MIKQLLHFEIDYVFEDGKGFEWSLKYTENEKEHVIFGDDPVELVETFQKNTWDNLYGNMLKHAEKLNHV